MLMEIIAKNTAVIVIIDENICGTLWDIIWRRVSVSFVYLLITSPNDLVSKNFTGSACIFENI